MTVRVGIVGCGFIAALHSRALKGVIDAGLADAAVVATCDADLRRAESFARAHGATATTDPGEVLGAVDAVYVCTPTSSHRDLVEAAAGAGLAVFCEKPLATNVVDAVAMGEAVRVAGVVNQVGLVLRTAPAYAALADLVASGGLGRPMAAVFTDDQYLPNQGQYASAWRADVAIAGGGTLLEHSIHDLDVLRWLLGDVVAVSGRTACFAGHPGIEDVAVATLTFAGGATASLTSVWHQVLSRPSTRLLQVIGEDGLAWVGDEYSGPLHVQTSAGLEERPCAYDPWVEDLPIEDPAWRRYAGQYAPATLDFLQAAAAGRPAFPGFDVAVAAHRVADAVYRSAEAGGAPVETALFT